MEVLISDKSIEEEKEKDQSSKFFFCHKCSQVKSKNQLLLCSNQKCGSFFCFSCIMDTFNKGIDYINEIKTDKVNTWKCLNCQNNSKKNTPFQPKIKDSNSNSNCNQTEFLGKKLSGDAELITWLSSGRKNEINLENVKFPFLPSNSKIKSKLREKLIKVAKQCEHFYRHKCKNEYIKKQCINCSMYNFHQNDLLRFFNYEIFLFYMKYLFLVSNKIMCYSKKDFNRNKEELDLLFEKLKKKKEIWVFNKAKIICKFCMFTLVNKPNFFQVIKELFQKQEEVYSSITNTNNNNCITINSTDYINNNNNSTNILTNFDKNFLLSKPNLQKPYNFCEGVVNFDPNYNFTLGQLNKSFDLRNDNNTFSMLFMNMNKINNLLDENKKNYNNIINIKKEKEKKKGVVAQKNNSNCYYNSSENFISNLDTYFINYNLNLYNKKNTKSSLLNSNISPVNFVNNTIGLEILYKEVKNEILNFISLFSIIRKQNNTFAINDNSNNFIYIPLINSLKQRIISLFNSIENTIKINSNYLLSFYYTKIKGKLCSKDNSINNNNTNSEKGSVIETNLNSSSSIDLSSDKGSRKRNGQTNDKNNINLKEIKDIKEIICNLLEENNNSLYLLNEIKLEFFYILNNGLISLFQ